MASPCSGALVAFTAHACIDDRAKQLWLSTLHLDCTDSSPRAVIAAAARARVEGVAAARCAAGEGATRGDANDEDRLTLLDGLVASVKAHGRRSPYPCWVQALAAYLALACWRAGGMREVCERNAELLLDAMVALADAAEASTGVRPCGDAASAFARRLDTLPKPDGAATLPQWWEFVERIAAALWGVRPSD